MPSTLYRMLYHVLVLSRAGTAPTFCRLHVMASPVDIPNIQLFVCSWPFLSVSAVFRELPLLASCYFRLYFET